MEAREGALSPEQASVPVTKTKKGCNRLEDFFLELS